MRCTPTAFAALISLIPYVVAEGLPLYAQCGSYAWTGPTVCAEGLVCGYINCYVSLCMPPTGGAYPTTTPPAGPPQCG